MDSRNLQQSFLDGVCLLAYLLPVSVFVEVVALQPDDDEGHDGLDHAELERRLWKRIVEWASIIIVAH